MVGWRVWDVMRAIDYLETRDDVESSRIAVMGISGGGTIAFFLSALDTRIAAAVVSGYFQEREGLYQEPIYRNVFGLLAEFGDAEVASLIAPRTLIIAALAIDTFRAR